MSNIALVTTSYKSDRYLTSYFKSLAALNQSTPFTLYFVANEPSPYTLSMLEEFKANSSSKIKLIVVSRVEPIPASYNRAIKQASEDFIAFHDIDDTRLPDSLQRQLSTLLEHPNVDFTYGDKVIVKNCNSKNGITRSINDFNFSEFVRHSRCSPTQFIRKSVFHKYGYFDEQFTICADYEFQARIAHRCNFLKTPGIIVYYTKEDKRSSASTDKTASLQRAAIELRYGLYDEAISRGHFNYSKILSLYDIDNMYYGSSKINLKTCIHNIDAIRDSNVAKAIYFRYCKKYIAYYLMSVHKLESFYRYFKKTIMHNISYNSFLILF